MRRLLLTLALVIACSAASATDLVSYRFDRGVVTTGDSIGALIQRAGQPDRTVQLQNGFGAGVGERWEYFRDNGKVVSFTITDSKIVRIAES